MQDFTTQSSSDYYRQDADQAWRELHPVDKYRLMAVARQASFEAAINAEIGLKRCPTCGSETQVWRLYCRECDYRFFKDCSNA